MFKRSDITDEMAYLTMLPKGDFGDFKAMGHQKKQICLSPS